ncbi:MAG TPA: radical SAM protein [Chloroflexota bacterium]|nr:radical SAM protein [Chloroflexota bacterium]
MSRRLIPAEERGAVFKDWGGRLPIALLYPNSYHVGMSSLGLQALYGIFNSYDDVVCERAFLPDDFDRQHKPEVLSLESGRQLRDFAVLAFSFTYELDYFNFVRMLRAANIPPCAADRGPGDPLIIAGGPGVFMNPEPIAPFLDAVVIGEGEPVIEPLLDVLRQARGSERSETLARLAAIPGVYVPAFYNFEYEPDGTVKRILSEAAMPVLRQTAHNLASFSTTSTFKAPASEFGHMHLIEIARGCHWRCTFCVATYGFLPVRQRGVDRILNDAREGLKWNDHVGLVSATISDHTEIDDIAIGLREMGVKISVSSMRVRPLPETLIRAVAATGTKTLTLGIESGSERLRHYIAKGVKDKDVAPAVDLAADCGFQRLKAYYMVGLPSETPEDLDMLVEQARFIKERFAAKTGRHGAELVLNVSCFVPKAQTPMQWAPQTPPHELRDKLAYIRSKLRPKGIDVRGDSPRWAAIEATFSRGDRRQAAAILAASEAPGNAAVTAFEHALHDQGLSSDFYARRKRDYGERLPWETVSLPNGPQYLQAQDVKATNRNERFRELVPAAR